MKIRKLLVFSLAFILCSLSVLPCFFTKSYAEDIGLPEPPEIEGVSAVYFYNITSDKLIKAENETLELNTSTSAKVMMGLLACEKLGDRLSDHIQVTKEMLSGISGVQYGFKTGQSVLVSDLLYAAICGSYNDAAYIVAYAVGGNVENFVTLMNKRAHELGASKTYYTNPIGYPDNASMVTTASDTAKIALAAYENQLYMEICSAYKLQTSEGDFIYNRNYLVCSHSNADYYNKNCLGMNAGYSGEAGGWSVITVAADDDQKYLCIMLGGTESSDGKIYAYSEANKLIRWALAEYQTITLFKKGKEIGLIEIGLTGSNNQASYVTASDLNVYLPPEVTYHEGLLTPKIDLYSGKVNAPVEAGHKVGELKIYYDGYCVGKCDLILTDSYEQNPILAAINKVAEYMQSRAFVITLISAAVLVPCAVIFVKAKYSRHKYKR